MQIFFKSISTKMPMFCKAAAIFALVALALSLVSILMLAPYTAAAQDDFAYGTPVHFTLEAGGGFFDVVSAVWENIRYTYMDWQGTFSSVALFSLEPGAFSDHAYGLTTYAVLAVIIAPAFLALGAIRGIDRWGKIFLGCVIAFFSVQYLPSPAQGYYWWNGAAHYLAFWFLGVLTMIRQIKISRKEPGDRRFFADSILVCFLGFCVGGGNYCTALVFPILSLLFTGFCVLKRRSRPVITVNCLTALFALAGLIISVAAPGNAVRQASFEKMSPINAVIQSFQYATKALLATLDLKLAGALALCIPVFLYSIRKTDYSFKYPPLILFGSFCALAALYTPPLYAMGGDGLESRLLNLFWLATLFFVFGNAFYLAGWASRRTDALQGENARMLMTVICIAGAVIFSATVLIQFRSSNAYEAYNDLRSPALEVYVRERADRERIYHDKSIPVPRFQPLSDMPDSFLYAHSVSWAADLLIDGVPTDMTLYHGRIGAVTYVDLQYALDFFGAPGAADTSDFSAAFSVRGGNYVSFRELCGLLGYKIDYIADCDTILVETGS